MGDYDTQFEEKCQKDFDTLTKQLDDYIVSHYGIASPSESEDKDSDKDKPICTTNEFKAVCEELGLEKDIMFSLDDAFRVLAEKNKSYNYHFKLGNTYITVYNYNNTKIQIDGLQFTLDYNTMTLDVLNAGIVDINSLDELKHKVNEYRQVYKRMNETIKKLQIEKDFNE